MAKLAIHKGPVSTLDVGGLRVVACRREVGEIDGGVTVQVFRQCQPEDEIVRMDLFRARPHYHAPATNQAEESIDASEEAVLAWGARALSERAPSLAEQAGMPQVIAELDESALQAAMPDLQQLFEGLAPPDEVSYFDVPKAVLDELAAG